MNEQDAYILDTDQEELIRLGIQHEVWSLEAHRGWETAGFSAGQTILDLGCGPGYCTTELAYRVGKDGKVVAVDKSKHFIEHLDRLSAVQGLNIETMLSDFNSMVLDGNSLDGLYCRWALAWLSNPRPVLEKVVHALKPGGTAVFHEYYDWSTHQTHPYRKHLSPAIAAALKSFKDSEGEIDIGRQLPATLHELGLRVISIRPMAKIATPGTVTWQWPKTFYYSYFPRLVEMNRLSAADAQGALKDLETLEMTPGASICCPLMLEVIARKKA